MFKFNKKTLDLCCQHHCVGSVRILEYFTYSRKLYERLMKGYYFCDSFFTRFLSKYISFRKANFRRKVLAITKLMQKKSGFTLWDAISCSITFPSFSTVAYILKKLRWEGGGSQIVKIYEWKMFFKTPCLSCLTRLWMWLCNDQHLFLYIQFSFINCLKLFITRYER